MSAPYSYEQINAHVSPVTPSVMHTKGNSLSYYFRKYLFLEAVSMVRWTLPETWPSNRLQYLVFGSGGVTVFKTDRYGLVYDRMGLTGINIFYNPTHSIIANPFIKGSPYLQIGKQCEIINLQPDYRGMVDIVAYYGDMMALAAQTIQSNLINSRLAYVFAAGNKASGADRPAAPVMYPNLPGVVAISGASIRLISSTAARSILLPGMACAIARPTSVTALPAPAAYFSTVDIPPIISSIARF